MKPELALGLSIALPVLGSALIAALGNWPNAREAATILTAVLLFALVAGLHGDIASGLRPAVMLMEPIPGLSLALEAEPLGLLFALVASFLWIVTSIYSIGYMRGHRERHQTRFYVYFAISIASAMGVAFAANLFSLFLFYEVLTLATFPLVTHSGTDAARRAGRVYLGLLLGTSIGLQLLAIVWTWYLTGTTDFTVGGILHDKVTPAMATVLLALYVFGIGKAAVMPIHRWLPAAMVAPTPVSALLHAVAVVKAGVFSILKVCVYVFGIDLIAEVGANRWLLYVAATTIIISSLVAMTKDNLKARLAYSTISQLSYVVLGALLANTLGVIGAGLHIVMHAFGKITLFFCAGMIMVAAHKTEIGQMRGLGRRMPFTMLAFLIGSLSIIGLPPMGGMWSKWYLAMGAVDAGHGILLAVLMLSSVLNVAYLLPIPIRGFFHSDADREPDHPGQMPIHTPLPCLFAVSVTSLGCLVLFFYPKPFYELMIQIAR